MSLRCMTTKFFSRGRYWPSEGARLERVFLRPGRRAARSVALRSAQRKAREETRRYWQCLSLDLQCLSYCGRICRLIAHRHRIPNPIQAATSFARGRFLRCQDPGLQIFDHGLGDLHRAVLRWPAKLQRVRHAERLRLDVRERLHLSPALQVARQRQFFAHFSALFIRTLYRYC